MKNLNTLNAYWSEYPKISSAVMYLSMSCPNGGSSGIYGLLTRNVARVGKFYFFDQGIPEGQDYWHPWSRWTGPVINLSSHAPKRGRKQTLNQGLNWTTTYINKWNILWSYACWNWKWYLNENDIYLNFCLLQFPLPLIIQSDLY